MSRFLHGLNREIQDILELYSYHTLEDLVHKATKVEQQVKRRGATKRSTTTSSSLWKDKPKKERPSKEKDGKEVCFTES